ncbi:MAG: NINE protein [Culicoidibacterales bacterium]
MYCKECGSQYKNEKAVICVDCGTNKGNGNKFCGECGTAVKSETAEVCLACGCKLKSAKMTMPTNINIPNMSSENATGKPIGNAKLVAGLLALFTGAMGIHSFYLGYKQKGFIQLGIFVVAMFLFPLALTVSQIWALYDAVQIFSGNMKTATSEELV